MPGSVQVDSLAVLLSLVGSDRVRWQRVIDEIHRRANLMGLQGGVDSVRCDVEAGRL